MGKMMQMLNAIAEPSSAITMSKEGTRMARRTMRARVRMRIVARRRVRVGRL